MKILSSALLMILMYMHPLFGQQNEGDNGKTDKPKITTGAQIRILVPGVAYKETARGRILSVEGIIDSIRADAIVFKSEHYDSLLTIALTSIKKLEIKTKVEKGSTSRKCLIGAGIGLLTGGIVTAFIRPSSPGVHTIPPAVGLVDGYLIGSAASKAIYGFVIGATAGGIGGYVAGNRDPSADWPDEANAFLFACIGGQAGLIIGGIIGLSASTGEKWKWKEVVPENIQIGIIPRINGGLILQASLRF